MSGKWLARKEDEEMHRVVMFLESQGHLPAGDLKVHDHALFFKPVHRFFEKTTLPPVAMTEVRQWRDGWSPPRLWGMHPAPPCR